MTIKELFDLAEDDQENTEIVIEINGRRMRPQQKHVRFEEVVKGEPEVVFNLERKGSI